MRRSSTALHQAHSRGSFARLLMESQECNGPLSLSATQYSIVFHSIQCLILLTRAITPLSYAFTALVLYRAMHGEQWYLPPRYLPLPHPVHLLLVLWTAAEVLFFPYYLYLFRELQKPNDDMPHFAKDRAGRRKLLIDCMEAIHVSALQAQLVDPKAPPPHIAIRKMMESWFLETPIHKLDFGHITQWSSWAFFGRDLAHMSDEQLEENREIVHYLETAMKWRFPPGCTHSENLRPLRLNLDPLFATQRPLLFYVCIGAMNFLLHQLVLRWWMGFRFLDKFSVSMKGQHIYYRPAASPAAKEKLPIVFVHGIGIGFAHYIGVLLDLPQDVDVFLVEWPYVAMQMSTDAPQADASVAQIVDVLNAFHHEKAVFVAHSLGTALVSWMLHAHKSARYVAHSLLIDPINFMLFESTVASVFVYRDPHHWVDLLMHFFLSRELFISNAISRHFSWSHNVLFAEELLNNKSCCHTQTQKYSVLPSDLQFKSLLAKDDHSIVPKQHVCDLVHDQVEHTIILSSHDSIVPVPAVSNYLDCKQRAGVCNFEVLRFYGFHGEIMLHRSWLDRINERVRYYSSNHHEIIKAQRHASEQRNLFDDKTE